MRSVRASLRALRVFPTRRSAIPSPFLNIGRRNVRHRTSGVALWVDLASFNEQSVRQRTGYQETGEANELARIVVSDNLSLDGVMPDPAGDEGFVRGGWVGLIANRPELARLARDEAVGSDAMLMGRRTYEWFTARWPSRTGPLADRLNSMPKYVVSSTLGRPIWTNTTVITGDVLAEVSSLKQSLEGDIVVVGSVRLVRLLLEHDLVDELRLKVFPVVLGGGEHVFGDTTDVKALRL